MKIYYSSKEKCYPDNLKITVSSCKIQVQKLLHRTIQRIFETTLIAPILWVMNNFEILCKWGCDGSNGQAQHKIRYQCDQSTLISDINMFMFSVVPIQLRCLIDSEIAVAKSSTFIDYVFSPNSIKVHEYNYRKHKKRSWSHWTQINKLSPTIITHQNKIPSVSHRLIFSMVDGKVIKKLVW